MTQKKGISGVIITFNEEANIRRCITSLLDVVDEVVVVDSNSTDNTVAICEELNARVVLQPFLGFIEQKNFALDCAKYHYVLSLDADEALSEELRASILEVKSNWKNDSYFFNRFNNYCGQWIYHSNWYPDRKLRLFDRRKAKWGGTNPHDRIILNEGASKNYLEGNLLHWVLPTYEAHIDKANKFSTIAAKEAFKRGKKASILTILSHAFWRFFNSYFLKLGILDGYNGFVICSLSSFTVFLKYIKLRQLNLAEKSELTEKSSRQNHA
ncbi:MAG: glycosyltransferase family 2 protein [Cyclobacteriaceae bacterium]